MLDTYFETFRAFILFKLIIKYVIPILSFKLSRFCSCKMLQGCKEALQQLNKNGNHDKIQQLNITGL